MPLENDMKAIVTKADIEAHKPAKIAKLIKKFLNPEGKKSHTQLLDIVSRSLGYSGISEMNETSTRYSGPNLMEFSNTVFLIDVVMTPTLLDVKRNLLKIIESDLSDASDFDRCFEVLNYERLDIYSERRYVLRFDETTITRLYEYYLYASLNCKSEQDIELSDNNEPSHRDDFSRLLRNCDSDVSYELMQYTVSELLEADIVQTSKDATERTGAYKDLVFKYTHNALVKSTILQDSWSSGLLPAISEEDHRKISDILLEMFIADFGSSEARELFLFHKNRNGFFVDKFNFSQERDWKEKERSVYDDNEIIFSTMPMVDEFNSSQLCGTFWMAQLKNQKGAVLAYASGGIYEFSIEQTLDGNFQFPYIEDSGFTREFQLVERIKYDDIPMPKELETAGLSDRKIEDLFKDGRWPDSDVIITISSWNKSNSATTGISGPFLVKCLDQFKKEYGDVTVFAYAAPMQYPDWLPETDIDDITYSKHYDVGRVEDLIYDTLQDTDKLIVVIPNI